MPYTVKGKCVYKKDGGAKVGCTKGSVDKYLAALHANVDESKENNLVGGKSDKLSLQDIADKFDVTLEKIKSQIQKGIKTEMEHTKDKEKATEIATDHVSEFPDYYDRLEKMEKKADKETKTNKINENKTLIKKLLRENIEEGKFTNLAGSLAMGVASMMSPKAQANAPKHPTEMTSEKLGVIKNKDGSFTSTVQTDGPNKEIAKQLAIEKAKNQILEKLQLTSGFVVVVKEMNEDIKKLNNGNYICVITIVANVE
jgi:leucyl aminopeptidase